MTKSTLLPRNFRMVSGILAVASVFAIIFAGGAMAQSAQPQCNTPGNPPCAGTFLTGYFDVSEPLTHNGTGAGDNFLRLHNPTANNGTLCAMIYVMGSDGSMGECCGCPVQTDVLLSLSVQRDLTSNWVEVSNLDKSGVIDIIAGQPNAGPDQCGQNTSCNGGCDPTNREPLVTTRGLKGYMLHNQHNAFFQSVLRFALLTFGEPQIPEVPLADSGDADSGEQTHLTNQCGNIIGQGSGKGFCRCTAP